MRDEEYAGYCCLIIAILCDLNADEARKMYQYGPDHPLCQKIRKKKVHGEGFDKLDQKEKGKVMAQLLNQGYSVDAVAEAFLCFPSTVRRRAREYREKGEEDADAPSQICRTGFFDEIGGYQTRPATEEYRKFFQNLHPSQFLNSIVRIPVYEVKYSYYTKRENYRVAYKYMFLKQEHEDVEFEIEMVFRDWVENMNKEKPYRAISNAEILEIRPVAYAALRIGL